MKTKKELKPCPFCGSEDVALEHLVGVVMYAKCQQCLATGPHFSPRRKFGKRWPKDVVTDAWNTRHSESREMAPRPAYVTLRNLLRH